VVGLYGAGALAAPPRKVTLVIDDSAAETVYDADTRRMWDHTRYLRDREPDDLLGLPPTAE
jgi:hypothetical protein